MEKVKPSGWTSKWEGWCVNCSQRLYRKAPFNSWTHYASGDVYCRQRMAVPYERVGIEMSKILFVQLHTEVSAESAEKVRQAVQFHLPNHKIVTLGGGIMNVVEVETGE
jgi:hypothetical protein